jgi:DNA repair exonuclease SbcCD nuclease subunit
MAKVALVTDTHFGARSDSIPIDNFIRKFYEECFWPEIDKHGIRTIFHLGDCFDRRKYINFNTLKSCREYFFDQAKKRDIQLVMIVGNHDTFFKNTNGVNAHSLLLKEYDNILAYSGPTDYSISGRTILLMPWICTENYEESMEAIKLTNSKVCFGHFEIAGFQMYKGHDNDDGFDPKLFNKFDLVCSGHFHHRSNNGNIHYLGNPYELTWADYDDPRGFHLFDTSDLSLEFIQNPFNIFTKIYYDDTKDNGYSREDFEGKHLKLIVVNKTDHYKFDKFIEKIYQSNPLELKIIEDMSEFESDALDDANVDLEDTFSLLSQYVDSLETEANKDRIKTIMKTLYIEAQNYEEEKV